MNRPDLFNSSVDVLVRAFFDGTLAKGHCGACAVGNLTAAAHGTRPYAIDLPLGSAVHFAWAGSGLDVHSWYTALGDFRDGETDNAPTATGYSLSEVDRIERAFEDNTAIAHTEYRVRSQGDLIADQFAGLMAVVDVLQQIHGADDVAAEAARGRFRSHPALAAVAS
ncbi:MAG TPA: hypothetical protein VD838_01430 [Anaeromyxobacteraceae bacterium]|nr:hypothetical protein [Anaeromyxobacteraceae bacterium]